MVFANCDLFNLFNSICNFVKELIYYHKLLHIPLFINANFASVEINFRSLDNTGILNSMTTICYQVLMFDIN